VNLFINDPKDGKTFETVYSPNLEVLQFHGELGYMRGEEFSFKSGITYNNFTKVEGQTKAWGLLPFEFNGSLRWKILQDLSLKVDVFGWDGAAYRTKGGEAFKGQKAFDLNAGLEFRITKNLDLWLQMNNLFNSKYQRWNQYEVYGFNVLGGVIFRFNQK
jgi:outer membrane receptor for ferrienterochelin and colicin